jgi:large subunit ribosomal protein L10
MPKLEAKQAVVKELQQKLSDADMVIFTDYRGLNVSEISELRAKLKATGADYKVYKNTMTRFALKNEEMDDVLPQAIGPNALLFAYRDPVEPAKILFDFLKTHKNLEVKGGLLQGKVVSTDDVRALSTLPPREVLIAKVLGGIQAPLYGFAYVLQANLTGLVRVLNGIREQKEAS